ncbi:hypothetical protein BKA70DRAFT_1227107 [Coprinopsis sp. MPI-PUGE-AT-0042]|nr:hypothetical protein BKA70DRAFT_1227107 [Coprinopsis sp. MPI-PUGE-AT-0042]
MALSRRRLHEPCEGVPPASNLYGALLQTTIIINADSLLQETDGFSISRALARANKFCASNRLPCQKGLDCLFSMTAGAGLTIIRNPIGSSTSDIICLARIAQGSPCAMKNGVETNYANAWGAPGCMKTNTNEVNGGTDVVSMGAARWYLSCVVDPILYGTLQGANLPFISAARCDSISYGDAGSPVSTFFKVLQSEVCDTGGQRGAPMMAYARGGLCEGMACASNLQTGIVSANVRLASTARSPAHVGG